MKKNTAFLRNALACIMLAGLVCSINVSGLRAQSPPCPVGSNIPPSEITYPWISGGITLTDVGGTNCDIQVLMCYRNLPNGVTQYYIYQINPLGSDCDNLTWDDLIQFARDGVHLGNNQLGDCSEVDPCSGTLMTSVQVYTSQCFKMILNSTGTGANLAFCDVGAYCLKTCNMCRQQPSGTIVECNCSFSSVSTPSGCEATPNNFGDMTVADFLTANYDTQSWPWTPGTCYTVNCGEN